MVDFFTNITDGTELMLFVKILLAILEKEYYGICRDFEMFYFEMRSLFFSLMKRTKIKAGDSYDLWVMIY
jgi:hypothetical protein